MKPDLIMGIDPGKNGAWAVVDPGNELVFDAGNLHVLDTTKPRRKGEIRRKLFDVGLVAALRTWGSRIRLAVVERGQTREENSRGRCYNTGEGVGRVRGVLIGCGIEYFMVSPTAWKPQLGLVPSPDYAQRKKIAREFARQAFPGAKFSRHDHAEAALIALWYIRRVMTK